MTFEGPVVVDPRYVGALGAAVVCGLLLLQYAHRRQPFILLWAGGWLLVAPALLVVGRHWSTPLARAAVGFSQFLGICTATLFLWSGDLFRGTGYVRPVHLKWLVPAAAWFLLAPLTFGARAALMPGFAIAAVLLAAAAAVYAAVLIERRMIGAGLIALVLLGLAVLAVTAGTTLPARPEATAMPLELFLVAGFLGVLGTIGIHLLVFEDMTYELRVINRRLEGAQADLLQAAITDPLTGCHNRRFFDQVMERELQRHARFNLPLSILFIDIDRFKRVNDMYGHEVGDEVLRHVARYLTRRIREADYVFRWGGDEFLALITCSGDEARKKAKALKSGFEAMPDAFDMPPGIGLSVGWIEVPEGTTDLMPLIAEADARMYEDKKRDARRTPAPGR